MKNVFAGLIAVLFTISAAAGYDYRASGQQQSPQSFEFSLSLSSLYPNSVIIFTRGHNASWSLPDVQDFSSDNQGLTAILRNDLIQLPEGSCGGLVAPNDSHEILRSGDHIIASSYDTHTLYYIPDCAWYNRVPRNGYKTAADDEYICESSYKDYTVRNITGNAVYRMQSDESAAAAFPFDGKCYYLGTKGTVTMIDPAVGSAEVLFDTPVNVTAAQATDAGIMAMTAGSYINIVFDANNAVTMTYNPLPSGKCMMAEGSSTPFCERDYPGLYSYAESAEKVAVTAEAIYILKNNRLTAYDRDKWWVKSIVTSFEMPSGCVDGNSLYYLDLTGSLWQVDLRSNFSKSADDFPDVCAMTYYKNGTFYTYNNAPVYRYATLIAQDGNKWLYKREQGDAVYYFNIIQ